MKRRQFLVSGGRLSLTATALAWGASISPVAAAELASISPRALHQRIAAGEPPAILDVRSQWEFDSGHIPGAIHIHIEELPGRVAELSELRHKELVVHCEAGPRAARATRVLNHHGFQRLVELEGHMGAWRRAGLPTVR